MIRTVLATALGLLCLGLAYIVAIEERRSGPTAIGGPPQLFGVLLGGLVVPLVLVGLALLLVALVQAVRRVR
jgi:hypothetical protein